MLVHRGGRSSRDWKVITEADAAIGGRPRETDLFGSGLASADFNRDGHADLAIGTPGKDRVSVLYGAPGGATFLGQGKSATLYGTNYFLNLREYSAVTLFGAAGAVNRKHTDALDYLFSTQGDWTTF